MNEEIKVSELDAVDEVRDTDVIMEISGGANKKATIQQVKDNIVKDEYGTSDDSSYAQSYQNEHNIIVSLTQPTTSERVWFKQGKNLMSSPLEPGTYTDAGIKNTSATNYRNSTLIPVQPNTTYTFSINGVSQKYCTYYYNISMTFISAEGLTTGTFTTPANCYYLNFRCFNADYTSDYANLKIQLELGDTPTAYELFTTKNINIDNNNFTESINVGMSLDNTKKVNFLKSNNLFNKNTVLRNTNINATTGALSTDSHYFASDLIKVNKDTNYYVVGAVVVFGFQSNGSYVGLLKDNNSAGTFNTGNAEYIRLRNWWADNETAMTEQINATCLNLGTKGIDYEEYITPSIYTDDTEFYTKPEILRGKGTLNTNYISVAETNFYYKIGNVVNFYFTGTSNATWSGNVEIISNLPKPLSQIQFNCYNVNQNNFTRVIIDSNGTIKKWYHQNNPVSDDVLYFNITYIAKD